MSGAYDAGFGDINAIIQNAATQAGRRAGHGLHDLQPGAVRAADQGDKLDQDRSRTSPARSSARRPAAPRSSCCRCSPRRTASTTRKIDVTQRRAEPAGADAAAGPGRRDRDLHRDELHEPGRARSSIRTRISAGSTTPTPASTSIPTASWCRRSSPRRSRRPSKGWCAPSTGRCKEAMANPDAAIELLAKKEPLINKDIEKRRLIYVYKTPDRDAARRAELGIGDVSDARMADIDRRPSRSRSSCRARRRSADVFSRAFLPPKAERMPVQCQLNVNAAGVDAPVRPRLSMTMRGTAIAPMCWRPPTRRSRSAHDHPHRRRAHRCRRANAGQRGVEPLLALPALANAHDHARAVRSTLARRRRQAAGNLDCTIWRCCRRSIPISPPRCRWRAARSAAPAPSWCTTRACRA